MSEHRPRRLRIATLGMPERTRQAFRMYMKRLAHGRYRLTEDLDADLVLIDLDAPDGKELWAGYRSTFSGRPSILISFEEQTEDTAPARFVRKPIELKELFETLEEIRTELFGAQAGEPEDLEPAESGPAAPPEIRSLLRALDRVGEAAADLCGKSLDVDPADPQQLKAVFYAPERFLQGLAEAALREARAKEAPAEVLAFGRAIAILPRAQKVVLLARERDLRPTLMMPLDQQCRFALVDEDESRLRRRLREDGASEQRLDAFLWELALRTSRGRVPEGTDLSVPMFLRHWPNFTRLVVTPHALRIAALWSAQPHTLLATARALEIPQRYVFGFYSALRALDLTGPARRQSDFLFAQPMPVQAHQDRSLFGRLAKKLGGLRPADPESEA